MKERVRCVLAAVLPLLMADGALDAQSTELPRAKQVCSMLASVISVRVVDAAGKAVPNATVRMTRLRNGRSLGLAHEMGAGSGEFEIVESTALSWIAHGGERFRLLVRSGSRSATAIVRVGRDRTGCRLSRLSGPDVVTLR